MVQNFVSNERMSMLRQRGAIPLRVGPDRGSAKCIVELVSGFFHHHPVSRQSQEHGMFDQY